MQLKFEKGLGLGHNYMQRGENECENSKDLLRLSGYWLFTWYIGQPVCTYPVYT